MGTLRLAASFVVACLAEKELARGEPHQSLPLRKIITSTIELPTPAGIYPVKMVAAKKHIPIVKKRMLFCNPPHIRH